MTKVFDFFYTCLGWPEEEYDKKFDKEHFLDPENPFVLLLINLYNMEPSFYYYYKKAHL